MNPPPIPPHSELSGLGGLPRQPSTPERSFSQNFSRTPNRRDPPPLPPSHLHSGDADMELKEEMRQRELEEVRARVAQMEKTMRWWSDCTANWREKWSKVRNERNQARDECRLLRSKLEASLKECTNHKRSRCEMESEMEVLKREVDNLRSSSTSVTVTSSAELLSRPSASAVGSGASGETEVSVQLDPGNAPVESDSTANENETQVNAKNADFVEKDKHVISVAEREILVSMKEKLEEANKKLLRDKDEKMKLMDEMSSLKNEFKLLTGQFEDLQNEKMKLMDEMSSLKNEFELLTGQFEDLQKSKQDAVQEISLLRQWKQDRMEQMTSDLEDEYSAEGGSDVNKRLMDLRKELEKLQGENAKEWAMREKLETEKLVLERENKKLHGEISHLEEEITRRNRQASTMIDMDMKTMQDELAEKTKELSDLRHVHNRLKKTLQERTAELEHARSRAEQYELEVKKLRSRIEELKRDLTVAEDEVDHQSQQARKYFRNNDELQQQIDNLTLQVQHLQSRLRRKNPSLTGSRSSLGNAYDHDDVDTDDGSGDGE